MNAGGEDSAEDLIPSRSNPFCYLCGSSGRILYKGLQDRMFGVRGAWNFRLCENTNCGLIWLDPIPDEEQIARAYASYYTHGIITLRGIGLPKQVRREQVPLAWLANPLYRERERLSLMYLDQSKPGKILDVGCGNGVRLARLRSLGWDVYGQDVDPEAIRQAHENFGVKAYLGRLEDIQFESGTFDYITLNHVIEHAHNPVELLRECGRILRKEGLLVVVTPNASSFAHKHFGSSWRGLEPPRHIHIFSPKALLSAAAMAGLKVRSLTTSVANAKTFGDGSLSIMGGKNSVPSIRSKLLRQAYVQAFLYRSIFERARNLDSGEECVVQLTK